MPLMRLMYCSRPKSARPLDAFQRDCDAILESSRRNNARDEITGALAASADLFLQVLEGTPELVSEAFLRIARDPRHHAVHLIEAKAVRSRQFSSWGMAFADIDALPRDLRAAVTGRTLADCTYLSPQTVLDFLEAAVRHDAADHSILGLTPPRMQLVDEDIVFV